MAVKTFEIGEEKGMNYRLDLLDGSLLYTPAPIAPARRLPLCIASYGYFIAGPGHFTERHQFRQMYQVFITHRGCGRFIVDGHEHLAAPGTVVCLDFAVPHRYETRGDIWEYEWVNFTGSAGAVYEKMINPDGFRVCPIEDNIDILEHMRELRGGAVEQDLPGMVHNTTRIIRLLDSVYTHTVDQERSRLDNLHGKIMISVEFMRDHYMEPLTLEQLAQASYMSKYYYTRQFRKYTGLSPYDYLTSIRISHVKNLLISTSLTIEQISWQTGFRGAKNLIRAFHQALGMTPGEYRKNPG